MRAWLSMLQLFQIAIAVSVDAAPMRQQADSALARSLLLLRSGMCLVSVYSPRTLAPSSGLCHRLCRLRLCCSAPGISNRAATSLRKTHRPVWLAMRRETADAPSCLARNEKGSRSRGGACKAWTFRCVAAQGSGLSEVCGLDGPNFRRIFARAWCLPLSGPTSSVKLINGAAQHPHAVS